MKAHEIVRAIATVHAGGVVVGASLADRIAAVLTPPMCSPHRRAEAIIRARDTGLGGAVRTA